MTLYHLLVHYLLLSAVSNALTQAKTVTKPLKIVSILEPPFVMKNAKTGQFEGIIIDILDKAGVKIDQMDALIHDTYGWEENIGKFDGIYTDLRDGKYDMAIAPLSMRGESGMHITSTITVFHNSYVVLYKLPNTTFPDTSNDTSDTILKPFSPGLWVLILALSLVLSMVLYIIRRFSPYENDANTHTAYTEDRSLPNKSCGSGFMYLLGSLMGQNASSAPCSTSGRILTAFWWLFSLMAVGAYVAGLSIVLSKFDPRVASMPYSSLDQMLSGTRVKVLGVKDSRTFQYMSRLNGRYGKKVYNYWKNNWYDVMLDSFPEALRKLNQGNGENALFMNEALANYMANQEPCNKVVIGQGIGDDPFFFHCPRGSTVCSDLNDVIAEMREQGEIDKLREKWGWGKCRERAELIFNNKMYFDTFGSKEPGLMSPHSITIHRFSAAFYILLVGFLIAGLVLMVEVLYARKNKESVHRRLKSNIRDEDTHSNSEIEFVPHYTT